jgi:DNA-binding response OmpR family regulator
MRRRPAIRVLVGDDHEDSASSLGFVLEACGFEVRTALDGQAALETAVRYRPDAIILDIGLPTLDGYEICRRIRADRSWGADVLILALTGRGTDDDKRLSREAGFDLHIVKPARPERLMALLETRQRALPGRHGPPPVDRPTLSTIKPSRRAAWR